MAYTSGKIIKAYEVMTTTNDEVLRKEADVYLNGFLDSKSVWSIGQELISPSNSTAVCFVGAHYIHEKLKLDYSLLKKEERKQLLDFVTNLITSFLKQSDKKIIVEKLCRIYACLGLYQATSGEDPVILAEIVKKCNNLKEEKMALLMIKIQNEIVREMGDMNLELRKVARLKSILNENLQDLGKFWLNMLKSELYIDEVFETLKNWAKGGIQILKLLELINFMNEKILVYPNNPKFYETSEILTLCLENCRYRKIMDSMNLRSALEKVKETRDTINKLNSQKNLEAYKENDELASYFSVSIIAKSLTNQLASFFEKNQNSQNPQVYKAFTLLQNSLFTEFPSYLFFNDNTANQMLKNQLIILKHQDRAISYQSHIPIYCLKEIIKQVRQDLENFHREKFFEFFETVLKIVYEKFAFENWGELELLSQKRISGKRNVVDLIDEDDEDMDLNIDERLFKSVSKSEYREKSYDTFSAIYNVMVGLANGNMGKERLFGIFKQRLDTLKANFGTDEGKRTYLLQLEATLEVIGSLRFDIYQDPEFDIIPDRSNPFILSIFEEILSLQGLNQIYLLSRFLQFFENFSQEYQNNPSLSEKVLNFIFSLFKFQPLIEDIAGILHTVAIELKSPISFSIFQAIVKLVDEKISSIDDQKRTLEDLINGVKKLADLYKQEESMHSTAIENWAVLVQKNLSSEINKKLAYTSANKKQLISFLTLFSATLDNLLITNETSESTKQILKKIVETDLPFVLDCMKHYIKIPNTCRYFSSCLKKLASSCPLDLVNYSEEVLNVVMVTLKQNPYKYSELFEVFGKILRWNQKSQVIANYLRANCHELNGFFLACLANEEKFNTSEFLECFVTSFIDQVIFFSPIYADSDNFIKVLQRLCIIYDNFNGFRFRKEFLILVSTCLQIEPFYKIQNLANFVQVFIEVILKNLNDISSSSYISFISKCFVVLLSTKQNKMATSNGVTPQLVYGWIIKGLSHIKTQNFDQKKIEICARAVVSCSNPRGIKMCIYDITNYINGTAGEDVIAELEMKGRLKTGML